MDAIKSNCYNLNIDLKKLYDFCIPKEHFGRNFFIMKVLKLEGLGSYLLRQYILYRKHNLIEVRYL